MTLFCLKEGCTGREEVVPVTVVERQLRSEALSCFLEVSKPCPWLVPGRGSRPGHPFCKAVQGGRVIPAPFPGQPRAGTEMTSRAANSAVSRALRPPSPALPPPLTAVSGPNHRTQALARALGLGSVQPISCSTGTQRVCPAAQLSAALSMHPQLWCESR